MLKIYDPANPDRPEHELYITPILTLRYLFTMPYPDCLDTWVWSDHGSTHMSGKEMNQLRSYKQKLYMDRQQYYQRAFAGATTVKISYTLSAVYD